MKGMYKRGSVGLIMASLGLASVTLPPRDAQADSDGVLQAALIGGLIGGAVGLVWALASGSSDDTDDDKSQPAASARAPRR